MKRMNKKGALVLRDVMFMLIVFSSVMALGSIFVYNMASEYSNTGMRDEFTSSGVGGLGNNLFNNISTDVETMKQQTSDSNESILGSFNSPTGIIQGAGAIFVSILTSPIYVGNAVAIILTAIYIPKTVATVIGNTIVFAIYSLIIFVIVSALLKGGKV